MGKTSSKVKNRWNAANYMQIKMHVKPETAIAFKAYCVARGVSMASELSGYMLSCCGRPATFKKPKKELSGTRGGRRKLINALIGQIEEVKVSEEAYQDRIPENLSGSMYYEASEQSLECLEEALEALKMAY